MKNLGLTIATYLISTAALAGTGNEIVRETSSRPVADLTPPIKSIEHYAKHPEELDQMLRLCATGRVVVGPKSACTVVHHALVVEVLKEIPPGLMNGCAIPVC